MFKINQVQAVSVNNVRTKVSPIKVELIVEGNPIKFEVDTGSAVSVCSQDFYNANLNNCKLTPSDVTLSSYTSEPIIPIGKVNVNVTYQNVNKQLELYVIPKGAHPLIGRNWLQTLGVEISFKEKIFGMENKALLSDVKTVNKSSCSDLTKKLVDEFPEVFCDKLGQYKGEPVKLTLKPDSTPRYFKPRPIPFSLKHKVEKELQRLTDENILVPVKSSDWGTPIVPVMKKNGDIRICGDFRVSLNDKLVVEKYPIPRIEDLFTNLQKGDKFSKIDLTQAYMQLELHPDSQKLCTISTHKGLFSYTRVPFGISSGTAIFQYKIEQCLQGLSGIAVFLDDILVTAENDQQHYEKLREVCTRLKEFGLTVRKDKCTFFAQKVEYLGFCIDKEGLHTSQAKVNAIKNAPLPTTVTEVKALVGLITYYSKFIPNCSTVLSPMYNLLKKDVVFNFDKKCVDAFNTVKELLSNSPILAHYDTNLQLKLAVDASSTGLGAVLSIITPEGVEKPIAYQSRTLSDTERNYSQIEKEALSIVFAVKKFNQYLYGRKFILMTDHKPLLSIFGSKKGLPIFAASRLQRYAVFLSGYDFDIEYVRSEKNNADCLSRLPLNVKHCDVNSENEWQGTYLHCIQESSVPLTCENVRAETQKDPILNKVIGYVKYGWPNHLPEGNEELIPYFKRRNELSIEQGIIMFGYKVVVPASLRAHLLKELHSSHMGIVKMKSVARSYIWFPKIDESIENLANSCSSCLLERSNPSKSSLHVWHYPSNPWERVHCDFLGPFKNKMFLLVIDAHSKWLEITEVKSTAATPTITFLRELFARYGLPMVLHSDNGSPFNSNEFKEFMRANGIKHTLSAPYHPSSNGQAESSVHYAKDKLKKALNDKTTDTSLVLSRLLFDYRNSVHLTTGETPSKLMFNRNLRTRLDLIRPNIVTFVNNKQQKVADKFSHKTTRQFDVNDSVLIRDYRKSNKWMQGIIVRQLNAVMYQVKIVPSGNLCIRHVDQLVRLTDSVNSSDIDTPTVLEAEREPVRGNSANDMTTPRAYADGASPTQREVRRGEAMAITPRPSSSPRHRSSDVT
ncbi:MAG: DDE-type integrase/transposase/recombinase, partial [Gammaproteobacteria bacterium]